MANRSMPATGPTPETRTVSRFDEIECRRLVLRDGVGRARIVLEMPDHEDGQFATEYGTYGADQTYASVTFFAPDGHRVCNLGVSPQGRARLWIEQPHGPATAIDAREAFRLEGDDDHRSEFVISEATT